MCAYAFMCVVSSSTTLPVVFILLINFGYSLCICTHVESEDSFWGVSSLLLLWVPGMNVRLLRECFDLLSYHLVLPPYFLRQDLLI